MASLNTAVGTGVRASRRSRGSPFVPLLLLLSLVLGAVSQLGGRAATLSVASGLLFGAAMVEVGRQLVVGRQLPPT